VALCPGTYAWIRARNQPRAGAGALWLSPAPTAYARTPASIRIASTNFSWSHESSAAICTVEIARHRPSDACCEKTAENKLRECAVCDTTRARALRRSCAGSFADRATYRANSAWTHAPGPGRGPRCNTLNPLENASAGQKPRTKAFKVGSRIGSQLIKGQDRSLCLAREYAHVGRCSLRHG